jgi:hypothetical protein
MPSQKKITLLDECERRRLMPPPGKSITKDVLSRRKERRTHEAWLAKVGEQLVENLEVPRAQLKPKKTKKRRRNPTKKKKKKKKKQTKRR